MATATLVLPAATSAPTLDTKVLQIVGLPFVVKGLFLLCLVGGPPIERNPQQRIFIEQICRNFWRKLVIIKWWIITGKPVLVPIPVPVLQ